MMVVTIQWELAERMRARARSSDYGALSVWLQSQCRVKTLKKLGPTVFWPRPKVDSAIVRLLPDPKLQQQIVDREFFHDFVRRVFLHRRKHLRSVLVGMYRKQLEKPDVDAVLEPFALKETVRAEELDVPTHVQLSNAFREKVGPLDE
jgi:16S rRNA (adenine1518-N6/adenine1519-N6)-dimethyltransferase